MWPPAPARASKNSRAQAESARAISQNARAPAAWRPSAHAARARLIATSEFSLSRARACRSFALSAGRLAAHALRAAIISRCKRAKKKTRSRTGRPADRPCGQPNERQRASSANRQLTNVAIVYKRARPLIVATASQTAAAAAAAAKATTRK